LARKLASKKKPDAPLAAPGPSDTAPQMPTPPVMDLSADKAAAQAAGEKQRKRAARGSMMLRPVSTAGVMPGAKLTPKSLVGY